MTRSPVRPTACVAALALLAPSLAAQSLYALDGATSEIVEFVGPSAPPFGHPTGPEIFRQTTGAPFACATPAAFGPPPFSLGDIAVDKLADTLWVTDGLTVAEYTPAGEVLRSFDLPVGTFFPSQLTGLGFDSANGILWMTDGASATGVLPPPAPACGQLPLFVIAPFALPITSTATDLAWDPQLQALWVCDDIGRVVHVEIDGTVGVLGLYSGISACGLQPKLQGIALDGAVGSGRLYVTDGTGVAYLEYGGAAGPPRFYMSQPCTSAPGGLLGLASSAHGIPYDRPQSVRGVRDPTIRGRGQSLIPGGVEVFLECEPDSSAFLVLSHDPRCPPPSLPGLSIDFLPPLDCEVFLIAAALVGPTGAASAPLSIAGFTAIGRPFLLHWLVILPGGRAQRTSRLHFSATLY